ncbi:radical SAM protein [Adlercreutzia equolifaciens subsp. celatus DSM 18785]|uniref:Radical SAM protein n=1 Tax=Adlercreutzia equolifaciens subsp. celatus DSM 18785 TaxID=1121021 RepID=A0A3N0AVE1_9ACTN|nr:radical SAM protein [Adlercreutzia equolifaciens subsp. celatus]RNL38610.1 radical SAM protein [Adlercreutzia equolifaciens subsp. celatus DSM 18785]
MEHAPFSIPMIGNTETGYVIGLTPEGAAVCHRMFTEDVPEAEVAAVYADLPAHLRRGGFVVEGESADDVALREGAEGADEGALGKGVEGAERTEDAARPEGAEREENVEGAGDAESAAAEGANMAASAAPAPLQSAYLHVTHHCNLNCIGCYSAVDARNTRRDLTLDELRGIIDALADAGCQHVVISGGEPFLRDDLPAIVAYVRERGIASVDVLTNGTAVTPEKLAAIAPYVGRVSVSFDGPNAEAAPVIRREPLFERLVAAVEMIREAGIAPHIIPTAHAGNIDALGEYVVLADSLGATMNFSLLSAPAESDELAAVIPDDAALARLAQATLALSRDGVPVLSDTPVSTRLTTTCGCGAGCAMVSVSADGEVFPCHMMHDEAFSLGSLLEDPSCLSARHAPAPRVDELAACADCDIRYLCGGGCRARAHFATGDVEARDPYCALMRTFYRLLFEAMLARN